MKNLTKLAALFLALALIATACGSDSVADTVTDAADDVADAAEDVVDDAEDAMTDDAEEDDHSDDDGEGEATDDAMAALPGEGVTVTQARASWSTGYVQAEIYNQLLEELGYDVSEPSALELDPSLAFLSMAEGEFDFWVNSWYPGHLSWHQNELPDGAIVDDKVSILGEQMTAGGLQGFLITKSVAEENGITTLDQIAGDPELAALFDQNGNGTMDIYGCPDSWTCDNIITEMYCQWGWEADQIQAGYDAMIAEATDRANAGEPAIIYTWTPSAYVTQMIPGDNAMWISVDNELDDSNCAGQDGGDQWAQPNAVAAIGEDRCLVNDAGECRLGWTAADIRATANNDFIDANPAAAELLDQVVLPLIDIALANVEQDAAGEATDEVVEGIASRWIEANRDLVDGWLDAAKAAG